MKLPRVCTARVHHDAIKAISRNVLLRTLCNLEVASLFLLPVPLLAQQVVGTQPAQITVFSSGFGADQMSVQLNAPYVNPGNCPSTSGQYSTDVSIPDNKNEKALLLTAFVMQKPVIVYVSGCSAQNYPRIVGVQIQP